MTSELNADQTHRIYRLHGQPFFVSTQYFVAAFHVNASSLTAVTLDTVIIGFMQRGIAVGGIALNEASATLIDRIALYNKPHALTQIAKH